MRCVGAEVVSLLRWSMLAASTIGPGTVIVCSVAGAEYNLALIWTLVVACLVAFIQQEESARLTLVSGDSFGCSLRRVFGGPMADSKVPVIGYIVVILCFIGNTAYEANCIAGAMSALYVLHEQTLWLQIGGSIATGVLTLAALFTGNLDQLGQALGLCVFGMAVLFGVTAARVPDVELAELARGIFIPNIPAGSSVTVLSLMATTAVPPNMFLAASLGAQCKQLAQLQRGIAFSSFMTCIISSLIVVVGFAIDIEDGENFTVEDLGEQIGLLLNPFFKIVFCIGLYAAAFSSAITCPLAAALCAEQILYEGRGGLEDTEQADADTAAVPALSETGPDLKYVSSPAKGGGAAGSLVGGSLKEGLLPVAPVTGAPNERWRSGGLYFRAVLTACVSIGVAFAASGLPTVDIIFAAQIINGLLLPFLTICLTLCLQDQISPGYGATGAMLLAVLVTLFLAIHLVCEQFVALLNALRPELEPAPEPEPEPEPEPAAEENESTFILIAVSGALALLGTLILALYIVMRGPRSDADRPPSQSQKVSSGSDSDGGERDRRQSMNI